MCWEACDSVVTLGMGCMGQRGSLGFSQNLGGTQEEKTGEQEPKHLCGERGGG